MSSESSKASSSSEEAVGCELSRIVATVGSSGLMLGAAGGTAGFSTK